MERPQKSIFMKYQYEPKSYSKGMDPKKFGGAVYHKNPYTIQGHGGYGL